MAGIPSLAELFSKSSSSDGQRREEFAKIPSLSELLAITSESTNGNSSFKRQNKTTQNSCSIPSLSNLNLSSSGRTMENDGPGKFTSLKELSTSPGNFISLSELSKSPGKVKPVSSVPLLKSLNAEPRIVNTMNSLPNHDERLQKIYNEHGGNHEVQCDSTIDEKIHNTNRDDKKEVQLTVAEADHLPTLLNMLTVNNHKPDGTIESIASCTVASSNCENNSQNSSRIHSSSSSVTPNKSHEKLEIHLSMLQRPSKFSKVICSQTGKPECSVDDLHRQFKQTTKLLPKEVIFTDVQEDIRNKMFTFSTLSPDDVVLSHQKKAFERES